MVFTEKRPSKSLKSLLRSACSILLLKKLCLEVSSRELYSEHFNSNCCLSTVRPDFLNLRSSLRLSRLACRRLSSYHGACERCLIHRV